MKTYHKDKVRGCLVGGAVGDALGYPVEFLPEEAIFSKYGPCGITSYDTGVENVAQISDDTQMTLFTAAGLLLARDRLVPNADQLKLLECISEAYSEWLVTQTEDYSEVIKPTATWLASLPELYKWRSPGGTCLSATAAGRRGTIGTIENPLNFSKGCGGLMRVAPIGLYFSNEEISLADIDMLGARAAALTHGHPLGYIPAAAMAHIICCLVHKNMGLKDAVNSALTLIPYLFPKSLYVDEFLSIIQKAIVLSTYDIDDLDAIHELGSGRCGDDNLAIAIYCSLKHPLCFEEAVIASVNHGGDCDSTGAVTGNIMGAHLGLSAIPPKFLGNLELEEIIMQVADELCDEEGGI